MEWVAAVLGGMAEGNPPGPQAAGLLETAKSDPQWFWGKWMDHARKLAEMRAEGEARRADDGRDVLKMLEKLERLAEKSRSIGS